MLLKETCHQGGNKMNKTDYFYMESELPHYLPYPSFLLRSGLSMTATAVYAVLLNRTTLSQKMNWVDEAGRVYCIYTIAELSKKLGRSDTTIKNAMKELVKADLLEKKRISFQGPNRIYLKCDFTTPMKSEEDDENVLL